MDFSNILQRWTVPLVLALASFTLWQIANSADIPEISASPVQYANSNLTPLLSARRIPETVQADLAEISLDAEIQDLVDNSPASTCIALKRSDQPIGIQSKSDLPLVPASNQKILTTFAALDLLGADYRFSTQLATVNAQDGGRIEGDLYLIGGGDPFLATDLWWDQYQRTEGRFATRIEELADLLADAGVSEISGSIIGDESRFDSVRSGPWAQRLIDQNQAGPLSALTINENYTEWPETVRLGFGPRVPSENPPLDAAALFTQLLANRGITVQGSPGVGVAPPEAAVIASLESPPLSEIVTHINSFSSNVGAELLLKNLGVERGSGGSTEEGALVVAEALAMNSIPTEGIVIQDGSGLSEENKLTCDTVMAILTSDKEGEAPTSISGNVDSLLAQSLSIGAERGSLAGRFIDSSAAGKVYAKTGTLEGVAALSGYVESAVEEDVEVAFVYIVNEPSISSVTKSLRDPFVIDLSQYPQSPRLSELSPRPVRSDPEINE